MGKSLFVAEKPSVAMEFVKLLNVKGNKRDGYWEGDKAVFTWCVGHMVTMSYPEVYNPELKKWSLNTLPFLPEEYKYEIIPAVAKQFNIVKELILREDIDKIYVCTDSGREGEYIYRLVDMMVGNPKKEKRRVWIDSQTEEEIKRGIKEAKPLEEYDALADSAYLRAKEDYLLGINFSRLLTIIYGKTLSNSINTDNSVVAVGRVMSCVLGMVVDREREIREFKETPFYRIIAFLNINKDENSNYEGEWKAVEGSKYYSSPKLYSEVGFKEKEEAEKFIKEILNGLDEGEDENKVALIENVEKKIENKNPPLLFNLAELQNECSKRFKIDPDKTLSTVQSLYEKKLLTYPRTDARVLSTAVAKEIHKNLKKLTFFKADEEAVGFSKKILEEKWNNKIIKSKYVNDKKITDHYAIIPTGEGFENYGRLKPLERDVYKLVLRRFLAIFYPNAKYTKFSLITKVGDERFFTNAKTCTSKGYLEVLGDEKENKNALSPEFFKSLKKGQCVNVENMDIKEGKTSPPKRYTSGTMIIAMENAGKLIEDEELREQIRGSGIGTSATRAEILKKLNRIEYIRTNNKTQVVTPTVKGEMIYEVIRKSIPSLLNPKLTASWEKGLGMVAEKEIQPNEFMDKLEKYIQGNVQKVLKGSRVIEGERLFNRVLQENDLKLDKEKVQQVLGICPFCHNGHIVKNKKGYGCNKWTEGCKFFIGEICGVKIPRQQVQKLIQTGSTDVISGFKSKKGNVFSAKLILKDNKINLSFEN
ncbi:type IA DNA topoisomerase [Clostridium sp. KNHs214]|uniref:type IA DNA topoisomerase n=1 Tax=Clostridium sp. KNHs214 TaxID=1540257 RepID=UPI00055496DD|nr:type IA DNA topoisomerase [Clostridium sp. KNHs214]